MAAASRAAPPRRRRHTTDDSGGNRVARLLAGCGSLACPLSSHRVAEVRVRGCDPAIRWPGSTNAARSTGHAHHQVAEMQIDRAGRPPGVLARAVRVARAAASEREGVRIRAVSGHAAELPAAVGRTRPVAPAPQRDAALVPLRADLGTVGDDEPRSRRPAVAGATRVHRPRACPTTATSCMARRGWDLPPVSMTPKTRRRVAGPRRSSPMAHGRGPGRAGSGRRQAPDLVASPASSSPASPNSPTSGPSFQPNIIGRCASKAFARRYVPTAAAFASSVRTHIP
jgi:hypothetical protein